jgi:hypothetical protein
MLIISGTLINRLSVLMVEYSENPSIPSREETLLRLQAARVPKQKKPPRPIAKVSVKKAKQIAEDKKAGTDGAMDLFFTEMRKTMTGKCLFCTGKSQKHDEETFHFSLAHLLPKAIFKSVATHPDNIIELCFYQNSCHTNFDNGTITYEFLKDSAEWSFIKEKLLNVLPAVAEEERGHKLYGKLINLVYDKQSI